jgi:hypothetical protein
MNYLTNERAVILSRGHIVIENGDHKGKAGDGQFLNRGPRRQYL